MRFNLITPKIGELSNKSFYIKKVSFDDFICLNQFFMNEFEKLKNKYPENEDDSNYKLFSSQIELFSLRTMNDDEINETDVILCKSIDVLKKTVLRTIQEIMMNNDHPKMKLLQKLLNEKNIPFEYIRQNRIKYVNKLVTGQRFGIVVAFNDNDSDQNDFSYELIENGQILGKFKYLMEKTDAIRYNYSNEYIKAPQLLMNLRYKDFERNADQPENVANVIRYFHKTITNLNTMIQNDLV